MQWRYMAVPIAGGVPVSGQVPAETASDARASLRRAGLRILRIDPVRTMRLPAWTPLREAIHRRIRARRRHAKSELLESVATMLDAGVSMTDALETISGDQRRGPMVKASPADGGVTHRVQGTARAVARHPRPARQPRVARQSASRAVSTRLRESIRAGQSLADSTANEPAWFDPAEIAMLRAGEHRGEIAPVLRSLAERHRRSNEVASKVAAALAYPAIVAAVGLGVVVFLSTQTLPQLTGVLREAGVAVPQLTTAVMSVGRGVVAGWVWVAIGLPAGVIVLAGARGLAARRGFAAPHWPHRLTPRALVEASLASVCLDLAELIRVGVPLTEALRVIAPSITGPVSAGLARRLVSSADRIERGESFSQTLDDPAWFDAEILRLVGVGENAGDLHTMLQQLGDARMRRARRRVDRLAATLEPAVILVLAALVGLVVMSAVLPMLRLQEVI